MIRNFLLLAVAVCCALSLVTSRHQARLNFVAIERAQKVIDDENVEYDRLKLDEVRYSAQTRIGDLAKNKLMMQFPTQQQIRVVSYRQNGVNALKNDSPAMKKK
jgi:cell division protein FtsL